MRDPAFELGLVPDAAREKVSSMLAPSSVAADQLRRVLAARLPSVGADSLIRIATEFGDNLEPRAFDAYFSHPVRVAMLAAILEEVPNARTVTVALLHNVYEIGRRDETSLAGRGLPDGVPYAIRLLTIDRGRENDLDYLDSFYARIEGQGRELALVRTLDKLDNLLGLELLDDGPVKESYIDLAERFVGPMANRVDAVLGRYFSNAVSYARAKRCDASKREQYLRKTGAV